MLEVGSGVQERVKEGDGVQERLEKVMGSEDGGGE